MRTFESVTFALLILLNTNYANGAGPGFGRPATADEIAAIDISIPPSGKGLPAGSGNAGAGEVVYVQKCASCHGAEGKGKPADKLVGGIGSLDSAKPVKSVGSFWPYATTLFDYINRTMPMTAPGSLTADEVYATAAYILYLNEIIPEDAVMNAQTLPAVMMPARDRFVPDNRTGGPEIR